MKLSTKLLLSYLAVAFLVLLVGASSYLLNSQIKDSLIGDSQRSITEIQRLSNLEFNLQNSLLFTRNYLFELSREVDADPAQVQLKSRNMESTARDHLNRFIVNLDSIRTDIPATYDLNTELSSYYGQLIRYTDSLATSFDLYRSLIFELFELEEEVDIQDEMFNTTIEPYFRTTLLVILDQFRRTQEETVESQMSILRSEAERNTRIIIIITLVVFIVASLIAYLIYHSIARPLNHLTLATEEIGSGNLNKRIQIGTSDELEQLGESFNKMAENLNKSMVSREYVNNIIQSMGDMLVVTDQSFEIKLINRSITETLNYQDGELTGKKIWSLINEKDIELIKKSLASSKEKRSFEAKYKAKEGGEIPVIISYSYLEGNSGEEEGIVFVASNITAQKEAEEKVNRSLKEKEVLLAEIHHRVKNNLAVISGLLEMQVWNLPEDDKSIGPLKESQLRIHSIALVHELLYQSETLAEIKLDQYINKLLHAIQQMHNNKDKLIDVVTELDPVRLTIQKAIPASLLLNELVVNSYKHAFNGLVDGQIDVILNQTNGHVELVVQDNGVGLPDDFDPMKQSSLGMTLIKTLVQQIEADFKVGVRQDIASGARFSVVFKEG
jgi:PAS domain S-box-containing protein